MDTTQHSAHEWPLTALATTDLDYGTANTRVCKVMRQSQITGSTISVTINTKLPHRRVIISYSPLHVIYGHRAVSQWRQWSRGVQLYSWVVWNDHTDSLLSLSWPWSGGSTSHDTVGLTTARAGCCGVCVCRYRPRPTDADSGRSSETDTDARRRSTWNVLPSDRRLDWSSVSTATSPTTRGRFTTGIKTQHSPTSFNWKQETQPSLTTNKTSRGFSTNSAAQRSLTCLIQTLFTHKLHKLHSCMMSRDLESNATARRHFRRHVLSVITTHVGMLLGLQPSSDSTRLYYYEQSATYM